MSINWYPVFAASVLQFVFSAIWYTPVFGKVWGRIHGFDKVAPEQQKEMMKGMWKLLAIQFLVTTLTTAVFALLLGGMTAEWNAYGLGGFLWLGFILPTQISAVLFGGTEPKWIVPKIAIAAGAALGNMMIAAAVLARMA